MPYIHFTDEQKRRANDVDLVEFLWRRGERLIPSGRDMRLESDHSVTVRGSQWYDHAIEKGGGAVSFLQYHYGASYVEAVSQLLGGEREEYTPLHSRGRRRKRNLPSYWLTGPWKAG